MFPTSTFVYTIDHDDRIVQVSDNWLAFAEENLAADSCHPEKIINRPIWHFIDGKESLHLYEVVLKKVRDRYARITFPFRCDSPDKRRYMQLHISPLRNNYVEFTSQILREEQRDSIEVLDVTIPRTDQFVKMCCMCKKVVVSENVWVEVEIAIAELQLFDHHKLPAITHGTCPECFDIMMAEVDKLERS